MSWTVSCLVLLAMVSKTSAVRGQPSTPEQILKEERGFVRIARGTMNPKAQVVLEHMKTNLRRRLRVSELARLAGITPSRLAHLFRSEVGSPPTEYLKLLRIERSLALLETSVVCIKEIAWQLGYKRPDHFARDFKKAKGVTPTEYRAAHMATRRHDQESAEPSQSIEPPSLSGTVNGSKRASSSFG